MIIWLIFVKSLSIFKLKVNVLFMNVFKFKALDLVPYYFICEKLNILDTPDSTFHIDSNDFLEYYSTDVTKYNYGYVTSCLAITDTEKSIKQRRLIVQINNFCRYIEIFPSFKKPKYYDDTILIKADTPKNYSKIIWDTLLYPKLCIDRKNLLDNINAIMRKSLFLLRLRFVNYPLLFFNQNLDFIHFIFNQILRILRTSEKIILEHFLEILNINIYQYDDNKTMKMYHSKYGALITNLSKDFYAGCFFTDIANILGHIEQKGQYSFHIYNTLKGNNVLKGIVAYCFEIDLNVRLLKRNLNGKMPIFLISKDNKTIDNFIYKGFNEKLIIIVPKLVFLNKCIEYLKIKIYLENGLYESEFLDVRGIKI